MKKDFLNALINIGFVAAGTLILSFAVAVFILPYNLVVGGMSGLALILHRLVPSEILTLDVWIALLTWATFFLGLLVLGKAFAGKTLIATILYPIGISLFSKLTSPTLWGGFFLLRPAQSALIPAALFGGLLIGAGCALTFRGGGSTGGSDIIAFSICKYFKRLRSSHVLFAVDAVTILLGMAVLQDFTLSLLGILSAFLSARVVDKLFLGASRAFIAQIVSQKQDAINQAVITRLHRTTTLLPAKGGYSGEEKTLLQISFPLREYAALLSILKETDPDAFVTILRAHEINGEGWTK